MKKHLPKNSAGASGRGIAASKSLPDSLQKIIPVHDSSTDDSSVEESRRRGYRGGELGDQERWKNIKNQKFVSAKPVRRNSDNGRLDSSVHGQGKRKKLQRSKSREFGAAGLIKYIPKKDDASLVTKPQSSKSFDHGAIGPDKIVEQ